MQTINLKSAEKRFERIQIIAIVCEKKIKKSQKKKFVFEEDRKKTISFNKNYLVIKHR